MSHLVDVNLLLACAWLPHTDHARANRWLNSLRGFATSTTTQMGFLRVSLSPAYAASFEDAQTALAAILALRSHRFISDTTQASDLPLVIGGREVTDAHLVRLAARHRLKLATLDQSLCQKPWARDIAENPLA